MKRSAQLRVCCERNLNGTLKQRRRTSNYHCANIWHIWQTARTHCMDRYQRHGVPVNYRQKQRGDKRTPGAFNWHFVPEERAAITNGMMRAFTCPQERKRHGNVQSFLSSPCVFPHARALSIRPLWSVNAVTFRQCYNLSLSRRSSLRVRLKIAFDSVEDRRRCLQ